MPSAAEILGSIPEQDRQAILAGFPSRNFSKVPQGSRQRFDEYLDARVEERRQAQAEGLKLQKRAIVEDVPAGARELIQEGVTGPGIFGAPPIEEQTKAGLRAQIPRAMEIAQSRGELKEDLGALLEVTAAPATITKGLLAGTVHYLRTGKRTGAAQRALAPVVETAQAAPKALSALTGVTPVREAVPLRDLDLAGTTTPGRGELSLERELTRAGMPGLAAGATGLAVDLAATAPADTVKVFKAAQRGALRAAFVRTNPGVRAGMEAERAATAALDTRITTALRRASAEIPPIPEGEVAGYRVVRGPKNELRLEKIEEAVPGPRGGAAARAPEAESMVVRPEPDTPTPEIAQGPEISVPKASQEALSAARRSSRMEEAPPQVAAGSRTEARATPLEAPDAPVTTQNVTQRFQEAFQLSDREAKNVGELARARAAAWADRNPGKTADDWFAERLAGIRRGEPAGGIPGLNQAERSIIDDGPVFREFKGKTSAAIDALRKAKAGEAIGALSHPDVGDIDLIWGKGGRNGYGLAKILERHAEVVKDLQGFISRLKIREQNPNSIIMATEGGEAVVRLNWKGDEKRWLLTAFEKKGPTLPSETIDVTRIPKGRRADTALPPKGGTPPSIPQDDFIRDLEQRKGQTVKGMTQFLDDGRALITAMKRADASTAIHEFAHVLRRDLAAEDLAVAEKWAGVKAGGTWSREAEEKFARAFERYVRDGVAPTTRLRVVFENLRQIMATIYQKLKGSPIDVEISPELRRVLDRQFQRMDELEPILGGAKAAAGEASKGFESMTRQQMFQRGASKMSGELSLERVLAIPPGKALNAEESAAVALHLKEQQAEAARLKDLWELAKTSREKAEAWAAMGDRIESIKILNDLNRQQASAAAQTLGLQDTINRLASVDAPVPPTIQKIMERRGINPRTLFQEEPSLEAYEKATVQANAMAEKLGTPKDIVVAEEARRLAAKQAGHSVEQDADAVIYGTYMIERGAVNWRAWKAAMEQGFKSVPEAELREIFKTASMRAERDRLVALEAAREKLDPTAVFVERYANRPAMEVIQDLSRRYETGFMDKLTTLAVVDPLFNPANLLVKNPGSNLMMQAARGLHIEGQALLGATRHKLFGGQMPRFSPGAGLAFYRGAREGLAISEKLKGAMASVSSMEGARDAFLSMIDEIDNLSRAQGGSGAKALELLERKRGPFGVTNFESQGARVGKRVLNAPGFILEANDRWVVNANRLGELYSEAFSREVQRGTSATQAAGKLRELAAALPSEVAERAGLTAEKLAFRAELGKRAKLLQAYVTSIPGGRFFVRYFRTPTNIAKQSIAASPFKTFYDVLNAARIPITKNESLKAQLIARYTGRNLDRVLTDAVLANAGAGLVAYWWANGRVSGKLANRGTKERAIQDALGMKDHALRIGDTWISYRGFGPFSQVLSAVADGLGAAHRAGKGDQGTAEAFADAMAAGLVAAGDNSYLYFLRDLDKAFDSDDPKVASVLANTVRSIVVPTAVAQAAKLLDPNERMVEGGGDQIKAAIPGVRNTLPIQMSPTGLPVERSLTAALGLPAIGVAQNRLEADLAKQGVGVPGSPKSLKRYRLTTQERSALTKERGESLAPALVYLMGSSWWARANQMQKQAAVDHLTSAHKQKSPTYQAIVRRLAQQGVPVDPED